jgi:hypothetical protein
MSIPNPLLALRLYLLYDPAVSALALERVYAGELPKAEADNMPRYAVVATLAGGSGPASDAPIMQVTVDIACYGATVMQATGLYLAVRAALRTLRRATDDGEALLHSAVEIAGPMELRDPETKWPLTWSSWRILAGETSIDQ